MITRIALFVSLTIGSFFTFSSFVNPHLSTGHYSNNGKFCLGYFRYDDGNSRRIVVNHEYSMEIPNSLVENKTLNEDASLQYADLEREVYILVIDEGKDDFIKTYKAEGDYNPETSVEKNYSRVQIKAVGKRVKIKGKPITKELKIDSREAEIIDLVAKVKGIKGNIFYKFGFLTSDDKCYMIMAWTFADYQTKNEEELESMIKSFRLEN